MFIVEVLEKRAVDGLVAAAGSDGVCGSERGVAAGEVTEQRKLAPLHGRS